MASIDMPRDVKGLIVLSERIIENHSANGSASPLGHIDMHDFRMKLDELKLLYNECQEARRRAEILTDKVNRAAGLHLSFRSLQKGTIRFVVFQAKDILKSHFRHDLDFLRSWGFRINYSKRDKRGQEQNTE